MKHTRNMKLAQRIRTFRSREHSDLKDQMKEIYEMQIGDTGFETVEELTVEIAKPFLNEDEDYRFYGYTAAQYIYNDFVKFTAEFVRKLRLETNKFLDAAMDYNVPGHREPTKEVKKDKEWPHEVQEEMNLKESMIQGRINSNYMLHIYGNLGEIVYQVFMYLLIRDTHELINRFFVKNNLIDHKTIRDRVEEVIKEHDGRIPSRNTYICNMIDIENINF